MVIPSLMVGRMIGKGGSGIKEVIANCGSRVDIQVSKEDEPPTYEGAPAMRSISICGAAATACQAQYLLLLRLHTVSGQGNWKLECTPTTPLLEQIV